MSQITTALSVSRPTGKMGLRARHRKAKLPYDKPHSIAVFVQEMRAVEAKVGSTSTFTSLWDQKSRAFYEARPDGGHLLELDDADGRGKLAKRYRNAFMQMLPKC
jgi:hypothetical protein